MSGLVAARSRTHEAVSLRQPASTLSREPSSATLGWMHMFLRLLKPRARILGAVEPISFDRYSTSSRSSARTCRGDGVS